MCDGRGGKDGETELRMRGAERRTGRCCLNRYWSEAAVDKGVSLLSGAGRVVGEPGAHKGSVQLHIPWAPSNKIS